MQSSFKRKHNIYLYYVLLLLVNGPDIVSGKEHRVLKAKLKKIEKEHTEMVHHYEVSAIMYCDMWYLIVCLLGSATERKSFYDWHKAA